MRALDVAVSQSREPLAAPAPSRQASGISQQQSQPVLNRLSSQTAVSRQSLSSDTQPPQPALNRLPSQKAVSRQSLSSDTQPQPALTQAPAPSAAPPPAAPQPSQTLSRRSTSLSKAPVPPVTSETLASPCHMRACSQSVACEKSLICCAACAVFVNVLAG